MKIEYVTSNKKKFEEAQFVLADWELEQVHIDLSEIQGDGTDIIKAKAKDALQILKRPLVVEDNALCCPAINGLPGPYIKDFLIKLGEQGLYELIHKYDDHRVHVICHVAYIKPDMEPVIFEGVMDGTIVAPRGHTRHGAISWNAIFQPLGMDKTFGELTIEEHSKISHRHHALTKLKNYLQNEFITM